MAMIEERSLRCGTAPKRCGVLPLLVLCGILSASCAAGPGGADAVYAQNGGTASRSGVTYSTDADDTSAVIVDGEGTFILSDAIISTSGNSSSLDSSSFHGLNAAMLVRNGSSLALSHSAIITTGTGANGAFATGSGSSVTLEDVSIDCAAQGAHAVMATEGGSLDLTDVDMTTAGANSGAIATDRGGGTISVNGGTVATSGQDSPGIYSTGDITVTGADITATGSESAVIEGANSITLHDTSMSSSKEGKWGVMIYQSMSGDAEGTRGVFTMSGGSLANTASSGPLFYVTNTTGVINLTGVEVTAASGILLEAAAGRWGRSGSNGGNAVLTADGQDLAGDIIVDGSSTITLKLANGSTLTGSLDPKGEAKEVVLELDSSSTWNVTADSYLTSFTLAGGVFGTQITNIVGNGHVVYYDAGACPELGGKTYALANGGTLTPR